MTDFDDSQGVNLLTLVRSGFTSRRQSLGLMLLKYESLIAARRAVPPYSDVVSAAQFLEALGVVHFGRWVMIKRLPFIRGTGQPRESGKWSYLLFMSNFNAGWRGYVDMFSESLGDGLRYLWGKTPGWIGPEDENGGTEVFLDFVNDHVIEHQHYYAAYPYVSTADVKAALHVDREVRSFAATPRDGDLDQWFAAYRVLLRRVQHSLGDIEGMPATAVTAAESVPASAPTGLTVLCPFPGKDAGEPGSKHGCLKAIATGRLSPFADVPGTHFARLAVIDSVHLEGGNRLRLESSYLLFAADVDGPAEDYLTRMYDEMGATTINAIWEDCYGFDPAAGSEGFVAYLQRCSFAATLPFADYPHVSAWDVVRALETHTWFTRLVFSTVSANPVDVRDLFEAGTGGAMSTTEMGS